MIRVCAIAFILVLAPCGAEARTDVSTPLTRIVTAYGGAPALEAIDQVEGEWVGYFMGRYQSRRADPPYDRMPIRTWTALDLETGRSVFESISAYPGELNLGLRIVNDGPRQWTMNTISRIYVDGAMHSHDQLVELARNRMPWMAARDMIRAPGEFEPAGTRTLRGIAYDEIRRGRITYLVHPDTALIHAAVWREDDLVETGVEIMRTYTDYAALDGVMVNRKVQAWSNGELLMAHVFKDAAFNRPIDPHLGLPEGFLKVASLDGYNGVAEIEVERLGNGVFLAGGGDTRVLYVEFEDHFVAMEAGGLPDYVERVYEAMRPHMGGKPLRYIIPTHHHDDHAVGVHFYTRIGAMVLTTRDKEGFLRRLLARSWGHAAADPNAPFRFIDTSVLALQDDRNRLDVHVYADAPHSENMLVGYLGESDTLYTCDVFIGWTGEVRQGASYGARHLAQWIAAKQADGALGPVRRYVTCHGRAYTAEEFDRMLALERTVVTLPGNEVRPTARWADRHGLVDDTTPAPSQSQPQP